MGCWLLDHHWLSCRTGRKDLIIIGQGWKAFSVVPIKNRKIMEDKNLMSADVDIVVRFFSAIDRLKADGCIGGLKTITDRYGLNRWNIMSLRDEPAEYYGRFRPSWVQFLVRDYHINPYWLLLGSGEFYATGFTSEIVKNLNKNCTRKKQSA